MKRVFLIALAVFAALLLALIGTVAWLLHDQDWIKGEVQEFVTELTGRNFVIDGPLEISLSADPVIRAESLRLANAPWAEPADMIRLETLRVSFELASVFSKQFVLHFIEADGLAVALVENDDGDKNWDLFPGGDETPQADTGPPPDDLPYRLHNLSLVNFKLSKMAPGRPEPLDLSVAELKVERLTEGQADASARGSLNGLPLELDGMVGPLKHLVTGGELNSKMDLVVGEIDLNFQGHVDDVLTLDGIDVELNFSGPEFEWITRKMGLPDFSTGEFDFDLKIDSAEHKSRIDLVGNLGSLDVNAAGEVDDIFSPTAGQYNFEISGPDLQALGETFGEPNLVAETYQLKGDASVENAVTQIHSLVFSIGENQGQVSGRIGKWPELIGSEFDFWFKGPDISVWGPLLRVGGLSSREYEFSGRFSDSESNAILTTVRLVAGDSFIEVAGSLGKPPKLVGSALDIRAMTPDLSKITILPALSEFPSLPLAIEGSVGRNEKSLLLSNLGIDLGGDSLVADGIISIEHYSRDSDIEIQAEVRNLGALGHLFGYEGLPEYPVSLSGDAQLLDGALEFDIRNSSLGELAVNLHGSLANLSDLKDTSIKFQLAIPALSAIPFDVEALKLPAMPGQATGQFDYEEGTFVLTGVDGSVGETAFKMDSTLTRNPGLSGSTLDFSVSGPDFRKLIPLESLQPLPGKFKLSGRIEKGDGLDRLEALELELGSMKANLVGTVNDLMDINSAQISVSASGPDLSIFSAVLDKEIPEEPFTLAASVKGKNHLFDVDTFNATWGESNLTGSFTLGLQERVKFNGRFESDLLSIAWLNQRGDEAELEESVEAEKVERVFPDTPIPENRFGNVNVDLELHAKRIILNFTDLADVDLELSLTDRAIKADVAIAGGPLGESVSGKFAFDTTGEQADLDLALDGEGFRLKIMTPEGMASEKAPATDFMIRAKGKGSTWHELASSLNGRFRLHANPGFINNAGMDLIFSDLLTELFTTLNPFAQKSPYTELECSLIAADIKDGNVVLDPLIIQTKEIVIVSGGTVDLDSEKIGLDFHTQVRKGIGLSAGMVFNPFIRLGGKLASPMIELDPEGVVVKGTVAVATMGLSVVGRSLYDRFLASKDPCGKALEKLLEAEAGKQ
jgi:uncharacterized protein involved in outer membrane biogenesis